MTNNKRPNAVSQVLNAFVMYGGMPVRRKDVIDHCRSVGVDEHSIGFFTLKPDVELDADEAKMAEAEWARMLRIEALEAEGLTFSDAQAVVDAEDMAVAA